MLIIKILNVVIILKAISIWQIAFIYFIFFYFYFEREREWEGRGEREREKESPAGPMLNAEPTWGSISQPWDHDLSRIEELNP